MKKLMVLVAALALVAGSVMTAAAADWNFFGSARVSTFVSDIETIDGKEVSDDYEQTLQTNARIGADVKVSDELTGGFEYGASNQNANIRKLYGEWDFGAGTFLVGQTYTPLNLFYSNQVYGDDSDLLGYGGIYSGRAGMLRLKFGGFQVALVPTKASGVGDIVDAWAGYYNIDVDNIKYSYETDLPAIEAKYSASFDNFSLAIAGGYQTYDIKATDGVDTVESSSDSYVIALGGSADLGAFYAKGNVYMGQNAGSLIWVGTNLGGIGFDELEADNMGYLAVVGFKVNDMFTIEAGYGYAEAEYDEEDYTDEVTSYYLQSTITLAPGVFIVPEFGVIEQDENEKSGLTLKETTYFGAKWQINF